MVKIKEFEAHIEQTKIDAKRVDGEQRRKNMEEEAKQAKYKAEYQVNIFKCDSGRKYFFPSRLLLQFNSPVRPFTIHWGNTSAWQRYSG